MLNLKLISVVLFLLLASAGGYYATWSHQQHVRAAAIKKSGERIFVSHEAEQIQNFKDR